jgi:hypothetical protein
MSRAPCGLAGVRGTSLWSGQWLHGSSRLSDGQWPRSARGSNGQWQALEHEIGRRKQAKAQTPAAVTLAADLAPEGFLMDWKKEIAVMALVK